jgi:aryl sulfotransferase
MAWPQKTRELHNHHMNSTVWNDFKFRDGDIVIGTYGKSGTTWMQQIVAQLIFDGAEGIAVSKISPWVDMRILPPEAIAGLEHLPHRRFVKTHLPVDALVFSPAAKYIYIGRDGRDAVWSLYNHHRNMRPELIDALNNTPGRVGPELPACPETPVELFETWFNCEGVPFWPFWENIRSWWEIRDLPNVKLVHFNDLKADLAGSVAEIAGFLGYAPDRAMMAKIVSHCTFDYMKAHAPEVTPLGGDPWFGGADTFIHKGTNGRWRDVLPAKLSRAYEERARAELGSDCADWLANGWMAAAMALKPAMAAAL